MALIIETGAAVANANSYVTVAEYAAYAAARGYTVGATDPLKEIELTKAMDYLEGCRDRFKGSKLTQAQSLQWPRVGVVVDGFSLSSSVIPVELKRAQMELAHLSASLDLMPSGEFQDVASAQLDTLGVSYHQGGSYKSVQHKSVDALLYPLFKLTGALKAIRA